MCVLEVVPLLGGVDNGDVARLELPEELGHLIVISDADGHRRIPRRRVVEGMALIAPRLLGHSGRPWERPWPRAGRHRLGGVGSGEPVL